MDVNWEDPPATAVRPGRRAGGRYGPFAAELRAKPDHSARITDFASTEKARNFAGLVEKGKPRGFEPAGAYVAVWDGTTVWVKYVGTDDEDADSE
jgi:hypothetical protein